MEHVERELSLLMVELDRAIAAGPKFAATGKPQDPWRPSPGKHCSYCAKPGSCPVEPESRRVGALASQEQAEQYAAEFEFAGGVREHRRDALKSWCRIHGPVMLKGGKSRRAIGFVETDSGGERFEVFTVEGSDRGSEDPDLTAAMDESIREAELQRAQKRRTRRGKAKVA